MTLCQKTVGTRRHCEEDGEHATIFCNPQKSRCREGVAEDCCMLSILLAVPSCTYSFWHGVIPTSYFIFNDFYTCFTIFYAGLAFDTIRESVDSLCRDGADTPMPPYIGKAFTRTNFEDLSLFRYLTIVYESLCTQ